MRRAVLGVVALLAAGAVLPGPGAEAAVSAPRRSPPPAQEPAPTTRRPVAAGAVALVDQTDWVAEGEPFDLVLALGDDVGPDASITLDLHAPVTSRSQFAVTLAGRSLGARRDALVVPVSELEPAADGTRRIRLTPTGGADAPGVRTARGLAPTGVLPLVVGLRPADPATEAPATFTTYVVRTPAGGTVPLRVALVQPVVAPLAHRADGTVALEDGELGRLAGLADVLAASAGTPLTIVPGPETLDALVAIADGDGDRPPAEVELAGQVLADLTDGVASRHVISRPWVGLRLDALVGSGLGADLVRQRRRGDAAVTAALGVRTDVRTWAADRGLGTESLRALAGLGVDHLLVPDEVLEPVALRLSLARSSLLGAFPGGPDLEVASPEPALSARYGADDPTLAAQHVLADLAVLHGDEPGPLRPRGVVLAPPAGVDADPAFLVAVLAGLATAPILEPLTLDEWFVAIDPEEVRGGPLVRPLVASGGRLGIDAAEVEEARRRIQGLTATVPDSAPLGRALGDLTLLAEADDLQLAERRAYLGAIGTAIDERIGGIRIVDTAIRLADSEGTIPLTLVREGDGPLTVRVVLESEQLGFDDQRTPGRTEVEVELAEGNTPLLVPVSVRSPGTFPLLVTITSPDGRLDLARAQVTIRSTSVSGVGIGLSVGAGFFLLLWWGRHWRTVRRAKRLVPVP